MYNTFNARSTYWIILTKEGVTIFDSHIRFSPLEISFGVEKLKRILLSSWSVPSLSSKKRFKTQLKYKLCRMSLLGLLSKGINLGVFHKSVHLCLLSSNNIGGNIYNWRDRDDMYMVMQIDQTKYIRHIFCLFWFHDTECQSFNTTGNIGSVYHMLQWETGT